MPKKYDSNAIWLALSENSDKDLFYVYPKLLAELLLQEEAARQDGDTSEAEKLVLPSDKEWRLQKYFYLVSMQKDNDIEEDGQPANVKITADPVEEWAPWNLVVATKNPHAPPPVNIKPSPGPAWDIGQVMKAGRLLCKPPLPVDFEDEQDMRCVYSLIYDVFRYKLILEQALDDVDFFGDFPEHTEYRHLVWLFLMELARRQWGARARNEMERAAEILNKAGAPFKAIERDIWDQRVHFAAAVARIRIKNKAFSIADLLPEHLKEERISACVNKETVTGWVNTFKAKKVALLVKRLHDLGYSYSNSRLLCAGEYRFDRICPRFITLRPPENVKVGQLDLVKEGVIVLQEREFCEGASTLCRALRANSLRGVVAQTHASSPRCSAYLAAQLKELAAVLKAKAPPAPATPELGRLVVFGAGDKVESYVSALKELGIDASVALQSDAHVCVLSEPVHCDNPVVTSALDGVVAVLATPPNSYSAVTDPIDLVCGRGGDLAMLEVLTESEIDSDGKARVQSILEEQKKTLKALMSKPQIQLILYETHSALEAENQAQVTRAISEANRLARERHALLKRKNRHSSPTKHATEATAIDSTTTLDHTGIEGDVDYPTDDTTSNASPKRNIPDTPQSRSRPPSEIITKKRNDSVENSRPGTNKARPIPETVQPDNESDIPRDPDKDNPNIFVPDSDLFEIGTLPNLGNGLDINYILDRDGCYLGLIQRKEITRLDAKFMIRVAEERGLFGAAAPPPPPRRKKPERAHSDAKKKKRKNSFEIERVAAPTYASINRSFRRGSAPATVDSGGIVPCPRHTRRHAAAAAASAVACTCDARHSSFRPTTGQRLSSPLPTVAARRIYSTSDKPLETFTVAPSDVTKGHPFAVVSTPIPCLIEVKTNDRPQYRRASVDETKTPRPPTPPCRRPFPLAVHDLRLKTVIPAQKVIA